MAKRTMSKVSPTRAQVPQYPPMVKQGSLYNLNFDEVQSQLGDTGKPLDSKNLDELQKNVISAESGQLVQNPSSDHSFIFGNIGLNGTLSNKTSKTISEFWRGIVHQEHVNRSMEQPSLGETTLENFLAHAGVINVGNQDNNVNVIGDTKPLMGIDPMVMPSQQEHWLQMQMQMQNPNINISQQQQQHLIGLCPDFSVGSTSVYENPIMEIGYPENSLAISMSHACSDAKKKNRYSNEVMEKTIERRQRRMAKNRESAARSRAKKQEHINKLEKDKCRLQKINTWLKKLKEADEKFFPATTLTPRYQLRRTSSNTF